MSPSRPAVHRTHFVEAGTAGASAPQPSERPEQPSPAIKDTAAAMAAATLDAPLHRWSAGLPGIDPERAYDDAMRAALLRLHASRLELVAVLIPEPPAARPRGMATMRPAAWWRWLRGQMRRSMLLSVVGDGLGQIWRHHPWRPAATALSDTLSPAVRQYPWVAVALSAGIGAAVVATRPWQWSLLAPHVTAAPRQARQWALDEISQRLAPTSGLQGLWVTAIGSGLARQVASAVFGASVGAAQARSRPQPAARAATPTTPVPGASATAKVGTALDDASITARVNAGLTTDSQLSALKIDVDTRNGAVELKGTAPDAEARQRATTIAAGVKGVSSVDNQLTLGS